MNTPESYVDRLIASVENAEKSALANELLPYHDESCGCRLCATRRWSQSQEAADFVRRSL